MTSKSLSDPKAGAVRIGCHNFLATGFVTAVIDRLSRSHPRMRFHLMAAETAGMQRDLHARNTDVLVAWRLGGLVTDDGLNFEHLYDDTCVVAAGAQHPLAQRRTVTLADLANERWALPPVDSILGAIEVPAFQAMKLEYPRATVISVAAQALISQLLTGQIPHDRSGLNVALSDQGSANQDLACRASHAPRANWRCDSEKPHGRSRHKGFHGHSATVGACRRGQASGVMLQSERQAAFAKQAVAASANIQVVLFTAYQA